MLRFRTAAIAVVLGSAVAAAAVKPYLSQEMPQPTKEHAEMQKAAGHWEGTITMHMPGMDPIESPANEVVTAVGGFWMTSDFTSSFMGMPYKGHGCHGYSPEKGKYTSTWVDNMSSYLTVMEGELDDSGKTIMHWEAPNMMGKIVPQRSEQVIGEDGNSYVMTFFAEDVKQMVIEMKRKEGKATEAGATKEKATDR